MTAVY